MLIFVVYDGINNSVFEGQVFAPLIKKLEASFIDRVMIVSFEKAQPSPEVLHALNTKHRNLSVIILKKYPFLGRLSLLSAVHKLKKVFGDYDVDEVMARGPLAGWICIQALKNKLNTKLTVQARGLLAEEYKYLTKNEQNKIKRLIYRLRIKSFALLEKSVYSNDTIKIESVTPALKDFLITHFKSHEDKIVLAHHDVPPIFAPATIASWKYETKRELGIQPDAYVYCFNGSAKPWQCAPEVISFFEHKHQQNQNSFLLILSPDEKDFRVLLARTNIPTSAYTVLHVPHNEIYRYLAACDAGLLFREPSPVNWVSRPTKVLEYHAVGLEVIHNNTVAWLVHNNRG